MLRSEAFQTLYRPKKQPKVSTTIGFSSTQHKGGTKHRLLEQEWGKNSKINTAMLFDSDVGDSHRRRRGGGRGGAAPPS